MPLHLLVINAQSTIGHYRDVWIAAIAWSRTSLATQTAVTCVCFQRRRVRHNANYVPYACQVRNLHCDVHTLPHTHITTVWVASLVLDCNGVFTIKAYGQATHTIHNISLPPYSIIIIFHSIYNNKNKHILFLAHAWAYLPTIEVCPATGDRKKIKQTIIIIVVQTLTIIKWDFNH